MKSLLTTTLLLLLCSTCHKNREETPFPQPEQLTGMVLDTLTGEPIPGCRVYLLETQSGFQHVVAETQTDSSGHFLLHAPCPIPDAPYPKPPALLQLTHNSYTGKAPEPARPEQTVWLKPYVPVIVTIRQEPPYQELLLSGSFNESGAKLEAKAKLETILTASVYDTLTIGVSSGGNAQNTKKQWIHTMNQKVDIP